MDLNALKKAKKEQHMTLQQIADTSGIPKRTVDQIFSGKTTNPRVDTLQAIETALGLNKPVQNWTDEEKALGVGRHATYLSDNEWEWQELRSEIINEKGEDYFKMLKTMIEAVIKQPK